MSNLIAPLMPSADAATPALLEPTSGSPVDWIIADGLVNYESAVSHMEDRVAAIRASGAPEQVWLLEHPPLYTAGTSADSRDLLSPERFPVYRSGRGGQYTYHGPGQRIAYVMLDLNSRGNDLRRFISTLEEWVIRTLAAFNIRGERRDGRVGVWVRRPEKGIGREDKVAAIGVRVRRWVSFHGIAINVDPVLEHFSGVVPCGVSDQGVTSLTDLGIPVLMSEVDSALRTAFEELFGPTRAA